MPVSTELITERFVYAKDTQGSNALTAFPGDQSEAHQRSTERTNFDLSDPGSAKTGGQFAALEHPPLLADELRAVFATPH